MKRHPDATLLLRLAFEKHHDAGRLSASYRVQLNVAVNLWERYTRNPPIGEASNADLAAVRDGYARHPNVRNVKSVNLVLKNLRAIFRRLARLKIIRRAPAAELLAAMPTPDATLPHGRKTRRRIPHEYTGSRRPLSIETPLGQFLEDWFTPAKLAQRSVATCDTYWGAIHALSGCLGRPVKVAHLNEANLERFLSSPGRAPITLKLYAVHLRSLWRYAAKLSVAPAPPAIRLAPHVRPIFSPAEVWRLEHATGRTLRDYAENDYFVERPLAPRSREQILMAVDRFSQWCGRPATLLDFNRETFNLFLADLAKHRKPRTVRGRRTTLLCLWNAAHSDDLVADPPKRVRTEKVPRKIPTAWTLDELRRILDHAQVLAGFVRGLPRCIYYPALIRTAYDTGLRKGDLFALQRDQIDADGVLLVPLQKTECDHVCRVRPATLRAIDASRPRERRAIFPPADAQELQHAWRAILTAAEIPRLRWGQLQQLRRTSATHVEQRNPGMATAHLGHLTPGLAAKSYIDPRISRAERPLPPDAFGGDDPPPAMRVVRADPPQSDVA